MKEWLRRLIPKRPEKPVRSEPVPERLRERIINPVTEPDLARFAAFRLPGVVTELKGVSEQGLRGSGPIETEKEQK